VKLAQIHLAIPEIFDSQTKENKKNKKLAITKHTPHARRLRVPSPAARHLQHTMHTLQCIVNGDDAEVFLILSLVTLTFDLDIQTRASEGPNTHLPCEFCTNPRYVMHKQNEKVTDSAKNRTELYTVYCMQ